MSKVHRRKAQSGYALLLMVLAFMGLSGAVAVGFTQQVKQEVDEQRHLHNQRVLKEAKQALLMYAYNYTVNNPTRGPGRLPCPDTSNNGSPNPLFNCENPTGIVGRFPWNAPDMNFYEARDASGEKLWYGVSSNFANSKAAGAVDEINASTTGTITIHDQSGRIMYDNSIDGVAAVIIAPGPAIEREDGTVQDRAADINGPVNFLDIFSGLDNADFDNAAGTDGFVMGPVTDAKGRIIVNDQMILVTSAEVTAMAQKAVLEQYRAALDDYQVAIWGASETDYRYPWTNAYASITDLNIYDVTPGTTVGRVPFLNFYTDLNSHIVITDMSIVYDFDLDLTDAADPIPNYLAAFNTVLAGGITATLAGANLSFSQVSAPGGLNSKNDDLGAIVGTGSGSDVEVIYRFFWDGCSFPCATGLAEDGWELCDLPATSPEDCALDSAGGSFVNFTAWSNHADIKIRRVGLAFTVDSVFEIGLDFNFDPASTPASTWNPITAPTAGANARREAVIAPSLVTDLRVDFDGSVTNPLVEITLDSCEQDEVRDSYEAYYLGTANSGTAYCTPVIFSNNPVVLNQLDITTDYYPELPAWVRTNRWNDSILLAYADDYQPGGDQDCVTNSPCLTVIDDFGGSADDKISLLLGSGMLPLVVADLATMFEGENNDALLPDAEFSAHPAGGNDAMLIMDEN